MGYLEGDSEKNTIQNTETIIKNFEAMESASTELFALMDTMLRETERNS